MISLKMLTTSFTETGMISLKVFTSFTVTVMISL
jgi:hypothetical protein